MANFCQQIRERAAILNIDLAIYKQQEYNRFVNTCIEKGCHIDDALNLCYDKIKTDFKIDVEKLQYMIEKSNIDYFINKFEEKLKISRQAHITLKEHLGLAEMSDERRMRFLSEEMIYCDMVSSLKIIKGNLK